MYIVNGVGMAEIMGFMMQTYLLLAMVNTTM